MYSRYLDKFREKAQHLMYIDSDDQKELEQLWQDEYRKSVDRILEDKQIAIRHLDWLLKIAESMHERESKRFLDYVNSEDESFKYDSENLWNPSNLESDLFQKKRDAVISVITGLQEAICDMLDMITRYYPGKVSHPYIQGLVKKHLRPYNYVHKRVFSQKQITNITQIAPNTSTPAPIDEQVKPTMNPKAIKDLYEVLKPYFLKNQQVSLLERLNSSFDGNGKLLFKDNGNKLAYAFRQLYQANLLVGCQKIDLESWIARNFQFVDGKTKKAKDYTAEYLNKIISGNAGCQSPIIKISQIVGQFTVEPVPRTKKKFDNF